MKPIFLFALLLMPAGVSYGGLVIVDFALAAPSSAANRLELTLLDGSTTTDLTGVFQATIDIDFATGVISSLQFTGGNIVSSDWSMNVTGIGSVTGVGTLATVASTAPPPPAVTGNQFDPALQQLVLTSGLVSAGGSVVEDFSVDNLVIPGSDPGMITATLVGDVWDISMQLGIDSDQTVATQNLNILGALSASGQVAVPEPSSLALLACVGGVAGLRRKRSWRSRAQ